MTVNKKKKHRNDIVVSVEDTRLSPKSRQPAFRRGVRIDRGSFIHTTVNCRKPNSNQPGLFLLIGTANHCICKQGGR